ncbi:MAG: rod shape-determining protein RodA, partial [Leisingera sp.]
MSYLEYHAKSTPTGFRKILHLNWGLILLLITVSSIGFLMLYSVAGGSFSPWVEPQVKRFALGLGVMFVVAMIPIWFWRNVSVLAYLGSLGLLVAVELFGTVGMGAQRWIDIGFMRLQPSEVTKIALVMLLAAYYDWLPAEKTSRPLWVLLPVALILIPTALVLKQPDLGTSILLMAAGGGVMFLAGVHWAYFAAVIAAGVGLVSAVFQSRGTEWQLLKDYQFRRIDTFLDPSQDPLGAGYHITQSKIALGSGGWSGRGFMQGTQSRLNFLPEKHTDFIFTTLAEEFGFIGGFTLLFIYMLIILFCITSAIATKDRFSSLVILGIAITFFLFFAVNMSMVMGLAPVVGVPLPMV